MAQHAVLLDCLLCACVSTCLMSLVDCRSCFHHERKIESLWFSAPHCLALSLSRSLFFLSFHFLLKNVFLFLPGCLRIIVTLCQRCRMSSSQSVVAAKAMRAYDTFASKRFRRWRITMSTSNMTWRLDRRYEMIHFLFEHARL